MEVGAWVEGFSFVDVGGCWKMYVVLDFSVARNEQWALGNLEDNFPIDLLAMVRLARRTQVGTLQVRATLFMC